MGGKKKAAGKKKGKQKEEEDLSTEVLWRVYRKKCIENGIKMAKSMNAIFDTCWDEAGHITKLHISEDIGAIGAQCLMNAMTQIKYKHVASLRLWKCNIGDSGMEHLSTFLIQNKSVKMIDLMDNRFGVEGCRHLGNAVNPTAENIVSILKLDFNRITPEGMSQLANGLSINSTINLLSLSNCSLDVKSIPPLGLILIFIKSEIQELNLSSNLLRNEGIIELTNPLTIAKSIKRINISDNQFGESTDVLSALGKVMINNKILVSYDLSYNGIQDNGANRLLEIISNNSRVTELELDERIAYETIKEIKKVCKSNKPKKTKGKKGKKKKKKK